LLTDDDPVILTKQEMMGVAVASAGPLQIICITLQTDNHASTSSVITRFNRPDALPDAQPSVSVSLKLVRNYILRES